MKEARKTASYTLLHADITRKIIAEFPLVDARTLQEAEQFSKQFAEEQQGVKVLSIREQKETVYQIAE